MVKKKVVKKVVKKKARSGKNVKVVKSKNLRVKKNVKPMGALGRLNAFVFGNFRVGLSYVGEVKNYIWREIDTKDEYNELINIYNKFS